MICEVCDKVEGLIKETERLKAKLTAKNAEIKVLRQKLWVLEHPTNTAKS